MTTDAQVNHDITILTYDGLVKAVQESMNGGELSAADVDVRGTAITFGTDESEMLNALKEANPNVSAEDGFHAYSVEVNGETYKVLLSADELAAIPLDGRAEVSGAKSFLGDVSNSDFEVTGPASFVVDIEADEWVMDVLGLESREALASAHASILANGETPEAGIAALKEGIDEALADGGITQAAHDKLTEIYTEAGTDSQKFAQLMVENDAFLKQESAKVTNDQANNHSILATMLADKGIDIGSFGSFGAIFAMIFVMIDPEMREDFMAKMKEAAGVEVVADAEDTQPAATVEETVSNIEETARVAALAQHQEQEAVRIAAAEAAAENTSGTDLGGVDGTAVTYITLDKPADVAVEGSAVIQTAMKNGGSVVSGSFNNNVTAEGSQVNGTVDQDAVLTPVIPVIEAKIAEVSVAQHDM